MDFTEQEASDKVGQYVLLIKDHQDLLEAGVSKGTPGIVVSCSYVAGTGTDVPTRYWAVTIRFYPPGQPEWPAEAPPRKQYDPPEAQRVAIHYTRWLALRTQRLRAQQEQYDAGLDRRRRRS
jgi:hypothetical protein